MDELHRHGSFTDSGSYTFYGTVAYIADRKDAGDIGLEQERIPVQCPSLPMLTVTHKVRTGQQEAAFVPRDDIGQKIRPRQCPNKDKHRARRYALSLAGIGTEHRNLFQAGFAMGLGHAAAGPQLNVRSLSNLIDQVL